MPKQKYYVVWKGRKTGIFTSWAECEKQVKGFVGAQYKAFGSAAEAETAYLANYDNYKGRASSSGKWRMASIQPLLPSICVDAACNGSPGKLEYRGLNTETGDEIFRAGPYPNGTNNIGEFLAIVHALTWQAKHHMRVPVYSDSQNAISWVYNGECKTRLKHSSKNALLFALIRSAENWLAENELPEDKILKWNTDLWGENPADFGRK
ncbi:MAG: ribonuclease H family protein [Anaerolineales bacterium]|nr:MAG: ribonuclease H family protein [Anaerolineales bacterium]